MLKTLVLPPLFVFAFAVPSAHATPVARFGWTPGNVNICPPGFTDQLANPGGFLMLHVAVTNLAEPYLGYALDLDLVPQDGAAYPDAWRFDPAGCQGAMWGNLYDHPPPAASDCGSLIFGATVASESVSRTFDAGANRLHIDFSLALTAPRTLDYPAADYLVLAIPFDHFHSVLSVDAGEGNCGGVERPLCLWLRSLRFQRPDGSWIEAARPVPVITASAATYGGPAACDAVPARAATWGAIKVQYR